MLENILVRREVLNASGHIADMSAVAELKALLKLNQCMGMFSEPPDPIFLSKYASDLGEIIRELRAEIDRLRQENESLKRTCDHWQTEYVKLAKSK